jgi:CHAT domain-containing protein
MARKWSVFQFRISPFLKGVLGQYWHRINRRVRYFLAFIFVGLWLTLNLMPAIAKLPASLPQPQTEVSQLQKESQADFERGNYEQAAEKLEKIITTLKTSSSSERLNLAIAWTNLGSIQLAWGQPETAIKSWQEAINIYQELNYQKPIPSLLISQAEGWKKLGSNLTACGTISRALNFDSNYCQSIPITETSVEQLISDRSKNASLDRATYFTGWRSLADLFRNLGRLSESQLILEKIAKINTDPNRSATYLSLANTLRNRGDLESDRQSPPKFDLLPWRCETPKISSRIQKQYYQPALKSYQKADSKNQTISSNLNQASLLLDLNRSSAAEKVLNKVRLERLKPSQEKIYAEINYAKSLACVEQAKEQPNWQKVKTSLEKTVAEAKNLKLKNASTSSTTLSYSLGNLGSFYEYLAWRNKETDPASANKWREEALSLTESALYLAQPSQSPEIAYQWQWQMGRLLANKGDTKSAITNYQAAAQTLETVQKDLVVTNRDVQLSFRDRVEPLYRELVELLLSSTSVSPGKAVLDRSVKYIQSLEVAELENFLQCQLSDARSVGLVDDRAAIIYPIVLKNRLVTILSLPNNKLRYYATPLGKTEELETTIDRLRQELIIPGERYEILTPAAKLYDWIIKPLQADLQQNPQINTLVFVPDTSFRNIPIGILYDREKQEYLLQKYAIAVSPGLNLLTPKPLQRGNLKLLAAGISEPVTVEKQSFPSLPQVNRELEAISQNFSSQLLVNQKFTPQQLRQEINTNNFSVIHLATHGEFSSDPEKTFILTYPKLLKTKDFKDLLSPGGERQINPDLLVLSACNTARGDRHSALGLAGIAVSSGASSTLATLWSVNDFKSAELMIQFYQLLQENPQLSKAKAIQQAQLKLLETEKDPYYWASYILVGNWL